MKFEENWPRGFRGEVIQRCGQTDGWQVTRIAHPQAFSSGELKNSALKLSWFWKRRFLSVQNFLPYMGMALNDRDHLYKFSVHL